MNSVAEEIRQVERRVEIRRERTLRHFAEAREEVMKLARWAPLLVIAGSLAIGFVVSRYPKSGAAAAKVQVSAAPARASAARGILASILALAATAMRVAGSNEARTFWNAFRAFRARRHAH
jgi:hypothetical protein